MASYSTQRKRRERREAAGVVAGGCLVVLGWVALNALILAGTIWLVVTVLRAMGVLS